MVLYLIVAYLEGWKPCVGTSLSKAKNIISGGSLVYKLFFCSPSVNTSEPTLDHKCLEVEIAGFEVEDQEFGARELGACNTHHNTSQTIRRRGVCVRVYENLGCPPSRALNLH